MDLTFLFLMNFLQKPNRPRGYLPRFRKNKKATSSFFLGRLWILKYQGWYIIVLRLFTKKTLIDFRIKPRFDVAEVIKNMPTHNMTKAMKYRQIF